MPFDRVHVKHIAAVGCAIGYTNPRPHGPPRSAGVKQSTSLLALGGLDDVRVTRVRDGEHADAVQLAACRTEVHVVCTHARRSFRGETLGETSIAAGTAHLSRLLRKLVATTEDGTLATTRAEARALAGPQTRALPLASVTLPR